MRVRRLGSVRDYLWAAVPVLLVAALWIYVYLPLDLSREYADGSVYRYVPDGAEAAMYGALAGAAASAVAAVRVGRRIERVSRS